MNKTRVIGKYLIMCQKERRYLFIILTSLLFSACVYLGESTTIDQPLNNKVENIKINGYYYYASCNDFLVWNKLTKRYERNNKQYYVTPLVFYSNGLVYTMRRGIWEDSVCTNNVDHQESLPHTNLMNTFNQQNRTCLKTKKDCIGWGKYKVYRDSLYIEYYDRAWQHIVNQSNKLLLTELYGRILNDSTILLSGIGYPKNHDFHFIRSETKPDSSYFTKKMRKR